MWKLCLFEVLVRWSSDVVALTEDIRLGKRGYSTNRIRCDGRDVALVCFWVSIFCSLDVVLAVC